MSKIRYQEIEVKVLDYGDDTLCHETCGTSCKRHARRTRVLWERGAWCPLLLCVDVGTYYCPTCQKYWTSPLPFAGARWRYTDNVRRLAVASIEEDRMPVRRVEHRMERDYGLTPVPSTLHAWWLEGAESVDISSYERRVVGQFSGVLCMDEVYDDEWAILVATDPLQGRPIAYHVGKTATTEDIEAFCQHLKRIGVDPSLVITDEASVYPEALGRVWKKCRHALCRFHVTRQATAAALSAVRVIHGEMPEPPKRPRGPAPKGEDRSQDATLRENRSKVWKGRYLMVKRKSNIKEDEMKSLDELLAIAPDLHIPRRFIDDWYQLFVDKPKPNILRKRRDSFVSSWGNSPYKEIAKFAQKTNVWTFFEKLVAPYYFENAEFTTNHAERENREYRKRQKAHYRMRSERSIRGLRNRQLVRNPPPSRRTKLQPRMGYNPRPPAHPKKYAVHLEQSAN